MADSEVDYQAIVTEKEAELQTLRDEFEEFQEMSKSLEAEMDLELEMNINRNLELQQDNSKLKSKIEKVQKEYKEKIKETVEANNRLYETNEAKDQKLNKLAEIRTHLEIDNEENKNKLRHRECELEDLKNFYNKTLEDLAITGSELDELKNINQEDTRRLREHINELNQELEAMRRHNLIENERPHPDPRNSIQDFKFKFDIQYTGKDALGIIDALVENLNYNIDEYKKSVL